MKSALKGINFLLVDDDIEMRDLIAMELEKLGAQVYHSINGKEAYQITLQQQIDLIISDVRMPEQNGLWLLENLKENETTRDIPFLLVSGYGDISKDEAVELGAVDFLEKPFRWNTLQSKIFEILQIEDDAKAA